jgi:hypothetical protein
MVASKLFVFRAKRLAHHSPSTTRAAASLPHSHTCVETRQPCGICGERKALGVSKERVVSPDSRAGAEVVLFAFGAHSPGEQVHHMPSPLRTRCRVLTNEQDPADSDGQQKIMDVTFCT